MSDKWIPTADRLPDQREFIESYVRSAYAAEFLVSGLMNRENRIRLWRGCRFRKCSEDRR